jgi:glutamate---cysteine ligase / carboxylate-amine ligase
MQDHPYTFGIEEEYFLIRRNARRLRHMPRAFFDECVQTLGERFGSEMLQTQVEVQTTVHHSPADAEADLIGMRSALGAIAERHGLAIIAAGTHPLGFWRGQRSTDKPHYDQVMDELQMLGQRNLLCGLHVHVQPAQQEARISLLARLQPFLPLLLALSTSSPFWMGHPTGLMSYRQTAYQEIPRSGLPPLFQDQDEYEEYVQRLTQGGAIKNASFLWWALRPSLAFPTLELRITDCCTNPHDALAIAQLFRCLVRHLERHPDLYRTLDAGDQGVIDENVWRAQRYGFDAGLIDLSSNRLVAAREMMRSTLDVLTDDIQALGCAAQIDRLWTIMEEGSSAHRQLALYREQRTLGRPRIEALQTVVDWLAAASVAGADADDRDLSQDLRA